jgi:hypothetical protein
MKRWIPEPLYGAKPWVFILVGAALGLGMIAWSWWDGSWTPWRSLLCFAGAGSAISGGAILQMRQNYRVRSKLRRDQEKSK